jgi:hypothetical protein
MIDYSPLQPDGLKFAKQVRPVLLVLKPMSKIEAYFLYVLRWLPSTVKVYQNPAQTARRSSLSDVFCPLALAIKTRAAHTAKKGRTRRVLQIGIVTGGGEVITPPRPPRYFAQL